MLSIYINEYIIKKATNENDAIFNFSIVVFLIRFLVLYFLYLIFAIITNTNINAMNKGFIINPIPKARYLKIVKTCCDNLIDAKLLLNTLYMHRNKKIIFKKIKYKNAKRILVFVFISFLSTFSIKTSILIKENFVNNNVRIRTV